MSATQNSSGVPGDVTVLMYHSVTDSPTKSTRALSVTTDAFAAQLRHLRERGYQGLTFGELCARRRMGVGLPARAIVITFDDGYADNYEHALPKLIEFDFPATIFITTGWIHDAGQSSTGPAPARMLSWKQIQELRAAGFEIGGHSHSHPQLDQLPVSALRTELTTCRDVLEDALGHGVPSFAYPFGYSRRRLPTGGVRDEPCSTDGV